MNWSCLECGEITDEGMEMCSQCEEKYSLQEVE